MNIDTFKKIVKIRIEKCTALMFGTKDKEYSRNGDKFHNFKRAASLGGITPEQALLGMWSKHLVSIIDIINETDDNNIPEPDFLAEKVSDNINYLFLLEGLIEERRENNSKIKPSKTINTEGEEKTN